MTHTDVSSLRLPLADGLEFRRAGPPATPRLRGDNVSPVTEPVWRHLAPELALDSRFPARPSTRFVTPPGHIRRALCRRRLGSLSVDRAPQAGCFWSHDAPSRPVSAPIGVFRSA